MKLNFMKNIRIEKITDMYYIVRANTKRFGKDAIMFEGINYDECIEYIKRESLIEIPSKHDEVSWIIKHDYRYGHYYLSENNKGVRTSFKRLKKSHIESILTKEGL